MIHSASTLRRSAARLFRVLLLPVFALTLIVSMWVALFFQLASERQHAHNEAVARSQALARVLSEHVSHILRQSDHATQLFKLSAEGAEGAPDLRAFGRRNGLLDSVLPARLELPMGLIGPDGTVIDGVHGFDRASVAGQGYFRALAANPADAPVFSTHMLDVASRRWTFQVARRLNGKDGVFAGAIVIQIDPMFFVDDYDRLNLEDHGALVLLARDAGLSAGRLGERLFIREGLQFQPLRAAGASSDEVLASEALDRTARIYSYSNMPRYPLVAVVGVTEQAAMARYRAHRTRNIWLALAASLLIGAVVTVLTRQSQRLRASMLAAREAQATLRAAADGSLDGVLFLKASRGREGIIEDFIIADLNDKGAALLGRPRADLLGQAAFALLPRYSRTGFFKRYVDVVNSGLPLEEEVELRLDDKGPRWIHHQIVPIPDGVAVTSRDITARKQSEIEIRSNRSFLQSLIDHLPLLIYVKSVRPASRGTMVVWNKAAETVTGYPASEVIGQTDVNAFPPGFGLCDPDEERAMLAAPMVIDLPEKPLLRPDGTRRYLHTLSVPLTDEQGQTEYILCIAEDITRRREQEESLRTSEARMNAVINASPLGLIRADLRGNCTYVNRMFETITGLTQAQALGMGWLDCLHSDDRAVLTEVFRHQRASHEPYMQIVRCLHGDGRLVWASLKVAAVRIKERIEGFVGSIDDITSLREAELALRESESRLRTIADTLPAMVAYIDANQVYRFHNLAYDREFRRDGAEVLGMTIRDTVGETRYRYLEPYIARALAGETLVFEENDGTEGQERVLEVTYIPQRGGDGDAVVGFHVMRQDITSQKHEKKRLLKLAQIDALTGLANRAGFMQKLGAAMRESSEAGHLMAVMYMDIDHFKPVNDTHGHDVGDALLRAFSSRLTQTLRLSDTVARLGGDEFTIIMEQIARPDDAAAIAGKIVAAMRAPFELGKVTVSVSVSIGLAYFRNGVLDPDALLKQADMLLYQAKQAGRDTFRAAA